MKRRDFCKGTLLLGGMAAGLRAQTPIRLRRSVNDFAVNDPFFAKYAEAIRRMRALPASDKRSWRNQARIHLSHCKHGGQGFLHWHRHYLANFEKICGEMLQDPTFALPYWDWTANSGRIPEPFFDLDLLNVEKLADSSNESGPDWGLVSTTGTRWLTKTRGLADDIRLGGAFTSDSIERIRRMTSFENFYSNLEGSPHNNAHVIVGNPNGHMGSGLSPLDPIFWLHHCNADRLWAQWQSFDNLTPDLTEDYSGHFVDGKGNAVAANSANAIKHGALGYTYEGLIRRPNPPTNLMVDGGTTSPVTTPVQIGELSESRTTRFAEVANFQVPTRDLRGSLQAQRIFRTARDGSATLAREESRIEAKLQGVSVPKASSPFLVNVWVNCPYVSPDLGTTDLHFAGSFSFFGKESAERKSSILVDIGAPLRKLIAEGKVMSEQVKVQAVAVPVNRENSFEGQLRIEGVQVFKA